jgi:hypothetical protein
MNFIKSQLIINQLAFFKIIMHRKYRYKEK